MKKKDHIQREVDKTMQSLDGIKKAETSPFFYTRLEARMDKNRQHSPVQGRWQLSLGWAAVIVVLLNVFTMLSYIYYQGEDELASRSYYLEEIYQEYELATNTVYEAPVNNQ